MHVGCQQHCDCDKWWNMLCSAMCTHLLCWSSCISPSNTIPYNTIQYDMICCTYHIANSHDFMTIDLSKLFMTYAYPSINLSARLWFYGIFEKYSVFYLSSSHWENWVYFILFRYKMWKHNAQKDRSKTKWWNESHFFLSFFAFLLLLFAIFLPYILPTFLHSIFIQNRRRKQRLSPRRQHRHPHSGLIRSKTTT